jgi:hypothetical protein
MKEQRGRLGSGQKHNEKGQEKMLTTVQYSSNGLSNLVKHGKRFGDFFLHSFVKSLSNFQFILLITFRNKTKPRQGCRMSENETKKSAKELGSKGGGKGRCRSKDVDNRRLPKKKEKHKGESVLLLHSFPSPRN